MTHKLTIELPENVYRAIQERAAAAGKSVEQVTLEHMAHEARPPERGSVDALMPFFGAWQMAPNERAQIEQMIDDERCLEDAASDP